MALSIEAALARRSSDVRTAGEGAAADDHAAGLWMERSTCGPVAMVRPCWLSLLPDDLLLPILSFADEVDTALMGATMGTTCRALHALAGFVATLEPPGWGSGLIDTSRHHMYMCHQMA